MLVDMFAYIFVRIFVFRCVYVNQFYDIGLIFGGLKNGGSGEKEIGRIIWIISYNCYHYFLFATEYISCFYKHNVSSVIDSHTMSKQDFINFVR